MKKIYSIIFLGWLVVIQANGQSINNHWQLGYEDLNFANSTPTSTTITAAQNNYGKASISDLNGDLLFYTDGHTIWNKNHVAMTNGNLSWFGNVYDVIIVPNPANAKQYYVFKSEEYACLCLTPNIVYYAYHIVEFNLANPNGIVLQINSSSGPYIETQYSKMLTNSNGYISNNSGFGPLTSAKNQTDDAYWIIAQSGNQILNYKLDNLGLNTAPVVSTFLSSQVYNYDNSSPQTGITGAKFRIANNNSQLIALEYSPSVNMNSDPTFRPDKFYKLDFNAQTGVFSNYLELFRAKTVIGFEISSNSNNLYYIQYTYPASYPSSIYSKGEVIVKDLTNLTTPARVLNLTSSTTASSSFSYLQRDRQGNLLVSSTQSDQNRNLYIHIINNQDSYANSTVQPNFLSLNNHTVSSLPQLVPVLTGSCVNSLLVTQNVTTGQDKRQAANSIEASNSISGASTSAIYHGGDYVLLKPSFNVSSGATFRAYIAGCTGTFVSRNAVVRNEESSYSEKDFTHVKEDVGITSAPNPNNGVFTLTTKQIKSAQIEISDLFGLTVFKSEIKDQSEIEINIQDQPKGIYIIKVTSGNHIYADKIIKY